MSVYLDVPFVSQLNYGGGMNDPTGCWYCHPCMIAYHFEAGPRLGVPELHSSSLTPEQKKLIQDNGIPVASGHAPIDTNQAQWALHAQGVDHSTGGYAQLKERENLEAIPGLNPYTLVDLEKCLRESGPIFFGWLKTANGSTYGHASVLIGTDDNSSEVIFHDPENARDSRLSFADFEKKAIRSYFLRRKGVNKSSVRIKS